MNIGALREIFVLHLLARSRKFNMKIVEMVDVKVPSGGECKRDGAGIDDSSLGMTMPL